MYTYVCTYVHTKIFVIKHVNKYIHFVLHRLKYKMGDDMGLAFRRKDNKNYVQFTTRYEEDLIQQIREISNDTGISINEVINQCVRYALENSDIQKEDGN